MALEKRGLSNWDISRLEKEKVGFSQKLRQIRHILSLNRSEFAQRLGISEYTIANLEGERTKPSIEIVVILMKELGVTFDSLFSYDLELYRKPNYKERHNY